MHESSMEQLWRSSHISGGNAAYVEELYEIYLHSPNDIPPEWRSYFDSLPRANGADVSHSAVRQQFELLRKKRRKSLSPATAGTIDVEHERKQIKVMQLISSYRHRGHKKATLDPLGLMAREQVPDLQLNYHGLTAADFDTSFQTGDLFFGDGETKLRDIVQGLERTYCGNLGAEIMHLSNLDEQQWFQQRLEGSQSQANFDVDIQVEILQRLSAAEGLERHLDSKYPGTKRFGVEGAESLIPMLDALIRRSGTYGVKEVVIGMAHRGRLNTLVNILGKNPVDLFEEFEGKKTLDTSGDVKYHQGFSSNVMTSSGEVHLALAFNPSHLEICAPVVEGSVRARQDRRRDNNGEKVLPVNIHGDAAFAGQGVVQETLQMSQTRGFHTGGTIHIVLNNQVGFTTSRREDARSTEYCTDVIKMIDAPVLHVNGDDPEAVVFATLLAVDYRYQFKKDIAIDLVCYRRRGHNETDDPSGTQPLMYQTIRKQKTTRTLYAEKLIERGVLDKASADKLANDYRDNLDRGEDVAIGLIKQPDTSMFVDWTPYLNHNWLTKSNTGLPLKQLQQIATRMTTIPDGIVLQRQVAKIYEDRRKMAGGALPLNWGMAETLAYGTLLEEGYMVRLTGEDVCRGTFSHRHAMVHSQKDGSIYIPLQHMNEDQPPFYLYDTLLSEEAVLAFEYGYATTTPRALVIWEAQFGDFANGAQVVIDQFITSGEHKWGRLCGLVLLLPHGYEGQGPEHSSARLERFMQLCAEHNIQVCNPTTPAQIFHLLRRQVIRPLRRPLVIMSPKWILRHKLATSSLEELADGAFQNVIKDPIIKADKAKRLVICSGKVYYHLLEARTERQQEDVALVRIEQLYPFPDQAFTDTIASLKNLQSVVWCQEEPMNQGAWYHSQHHLHRLLADVHPGLELSYVGRAASAAPAAGYMSTHLEEQNTFINEALTVL